MRIKDYYTIAFKNIRRRPLRSFLTIIALAISTCVLTIMVAVSLGGQKTILNQFGTDDSLSLIIATSSQTSAGLSPFGDVQLAGQAQIKLDDAAAAKLAALPHVQSAAPRAHIWEFDTFTIPVTGKIFQAQTEAIPNSSYLPLQAGRGFTAGGDAHTAIAGYAYAKALGIAPEGLIGQTIAITTQKGYRGQGAHIPASYATQQQTDNFNTTPSTLTAKIIGVTQPGPNQNSLFIPLDWAGQIRTAHYYEGDTPKVIDQLARDGYTSVQVKADTLANVAAVANGVKNLGFGQTSLLQTAQELNQLTATIGVVLGAVALIAMLAATLGVINTMIMAVSEQRYEIGIWRACGARRSTIVQLFLTEAALLGAIGGSLGVLASLPLAGIITSYGSAILYTHGLEPAALASVSPLLGAGAVALTVGFSVLAGLYPAYRATKLDPSQVLNAG